MPDLFSNICFDPQIVGPWVSKKTGGTWSEGRGTAIGKLKDKKLIAGVLYEDWNGANIICHIAGDPGWACRMYLGLIFDYPFNQLKAKRITVPVCSTNHASIKLVRHMGFELESELVGATRLGNMLLFRMFKEECKYLRGKYALHRSS